MLDDLLQNDDEGGGEFSVFPWDFFGLRQVEVEGGRHYTWFSVAEGFLHFLLVVGDGVAVDFLLRIGRCLRFSGGRGWPSSG